MAERFFYPGPLPAETVRLTGEEMHHMVHVCRLRVGDSVVLFNGDGREYRAVIRKIARREVELTVASVAETSRELPVTIHVAAPLPKGDRAHFLIEKLTEIGVARYIPLLTRRSVISPGQERLDKLRRYVIEACKQCGRNRLMEIALPMPLAELVTLGGEGCRLLADFQGQPFAEYCWRRPREVVVAVGPEGGFTPEEVAQAVQAGWTQVALGPTILRTETAALALASCLAYCPG